MNTRTLALVVVLAAINTVTPVYAMTIDPEDDYLSACEDKADGVACGFNDENGEAVIGNCEYMTAGENEGDLVCVPQN